MTQAMDTVTTIRKRLYPRLRTNNFDEWERLFTLLNPMWIIDGDTHFKEGVLMHLPDIGPQD